MKNFDSVGAWESAMGSLTARNVLFFVAFFGGRFVGASFADGTIAWGADWDSIAEFFDLLFINQDQSVFFLVAAPIFTTCWFLIIFSSLPKLPLYYLTGVASSVLSFLCLTLRSNQTHWFLTPVLLLFLAMPWHLWKRLGAEEA